MSHRFGISRKKVGLAPGTVVFTGKQQIDLAKRTMIRYDAGAADTLELQASDPIKRPNADDTVVTWINVDGLHDVDLIEAFGREFDLHPLALEDVVSVSGRPSTSDYETHLFASLRMLSWGPDELIQDEKISLILGSNWLLSFQERPGDVFDFLRKRFQKPKSRLRSRGADYLWYAIIDAVVDHYIIVVDEIASRADAIEQEVWQDDNGKDLPATVQQLRRQTLIVRRALRPLREEIDLILADPPDLISPDNAPFLRDLREHLLELSDSLENVRETLSSAMDAHLSLLSMKANSVMKLLTVMASIFIPLTFIAGVYGMNFQHMPELQLPWAYPAVWVVMIVLALGMLGMFRLKRLL